jgi:AcrR family transcriptional regulator
VNAARSAPNVQRRSPEARRAILDAAITLISERGYANVTIEAIAASAGVGKTTIYRWWSSKGELSLEAINDRVGETIDFPDTGDITTDLRHQLLEVARVLNGEIGVVFRGVVAEAQSTPKIGAALLETIIEPRTRACEARLAKAVGGGQLRPDVSTRMMVELIYAPLYYRLLFGIDPVRSRDISLLLDYTLSGLRPVSTGR